jgi:hypothetical protein
MVVINKFKNFFKKFWLFIVLATIATVLFGLYFFQKNLSEKTTGNLLPLPSIDIETYPISVSPIVDISLIEKNFPPFNNKAEVYQALPSFFSDQEAVMIAKKLGFFGSPSVSRNQQNENIYTWNANDKFLAINLHRGQVEFGLTPSYEEITPLGISLSLAAAENIAKDFLRVNNLLPPENISMEQKSISYIKTQNIYYKEVSTPPEANAVQIGFGYKINNKEITDSHALITINLDSQIIGFIYQPPFKEIKLLDIYPLKTKEEIVQILKTKKSINYFFIPNYYGSTAEESQNITNLTFDNIELVYYKYDPLQTYLQPVFLITGKATLKGGQQGEVGLYLPAISDKYLLK